MHQFMSYITSSKPFAHKMQFVCPDVVFGLASNIRGRCFFLFRDKSVYDFIQRLFIFPKEYIYGDVFNFKSKDR